MEDRKTLALKRIKRMMENGLKAQLSRKDRTFHESWMTSKNIADRVVEECLWGLSDVEQTKEQKDESDR
jgi:hypothetical protein